MRQHEIEENLRYWSNIAAERGDDIEPRDVDEREIDGMSRCWENDSMYLGSDSDFSDHALGIDY